MCAPARLRSATRQHNNRTRHQTPGARRHTRLLAHTDGCFEFPCIWQGVTWYGLVGLMRGLSSLATVGGPSKMHSRDSTYSGGGGKGVGGDARNSAYHTSTQNSSRGFRRAHSSHSDKGRRDGGRRGWRMQVSVACRNEKTEVQDGILGISEKCLWTQQLHAFHRERKSA